MWFGDLVTMRWWNGIWLNEAFATFMEIAACDAFRPDWEPLDAVRARALGRVRDRLAGAAPARSSTRCARPPDCEGMFDVLTYQKGGALLRMLEQYLGEERFREGVSHYLRTHAYGNTETNDLWDAIEATSGEPVRRMMDSWIWQPGYPLVSASLDGDELVLRQQRFAFDARHARRRRDADDVARAGPRPRRRRVDDRCCSTATRRGSRSPTRRRRSSSTPAATASTASPTTTSCAAGSPARCSASLDTLERYNLVDDAWNEVVAGRLAAADFLTFVEGFGGERELAVWQAIVLGLRGLGRLLDDDAYPRVPGAGRAPCSAPVVAELGDPAAGEDDLRGKLRGLLVAALAIQGDDAADPGAGRRAVRARGGRAGQRRPRAGRRGHVDRRRHAATPPSTSGCSPATARRRRRRTSCATSTRSPSSTTRR